MTGQSFAYHSRKTLNIEEKQDSPDRERHVIKTFPAGIYRTRIFLRDHRKVATTKQSSL